MEISDNRKIILAEPRGFCAGVRRALDTVEAALKSHGAPVFVMHEIVHNRVVVDDLKARGVVFVEDLGACTRGRPVIFSAHGVPPMMERQAERMGGGFIDATCPLVKKIHRETEKYSQMGFKIILIGHAGHPELVGVKGHARGDVFIVESVQDIEGIPFQREDKVACFSQTTLDVESVLETVAEIRGKFPLLICNPEYDVCYATRNRQHAIRKVAGKSDVVLVIGSGNSSNSARLRDAALKICGRAYLLENSVCLSDEMIAGANAIGISAGASAPEFLVQELVSVLQGRGWREIENICCAREEQSFKLPDFNLSC